MQGKTHFAIGEAAALLLLCPQTPKELALCVGTAAVGSLLPDADATTSRSHRELTRLIGVAGMAFVAVTVLELQYDLGIYQMLQRQTSLFRILMGLAAFLMICFYGMNRPHRTFMHSLTCLGILSAVVWDIFPALLPAFVISVFTHLLLDLANRQGLQLFYPMRKKFSLRLCSSKGYVNELLGKIGGIAALIGLIRCIYLIF